MPERILEIINLQSNLTQGGTWTTFFQTYSKSDLVIKLMSGTDYRRYRIPKHLLWETHKLKAQGGERSGNTITVRDYQCDGQQSNIKNTAVTSGRHWLSFTFGDTVGALAHNFACDSGTLDDTCTVSTVQTMANGDNINGTGKPHYSKQEGILPLLPETDLPSTWEEILPSSREGRSRETLMPLRQISRLMREAPSTLMEKGMPRSRTRSRDSHQQ